MPCPALSPRFSLPRSALVVLTRLPLLILLPMGSTAAFSQETSAQEVTQADPADVESVDAIIDAVYDVISGPAGAPRNWERWASLFIPEARLVSVGRDPEGKLTHRVMSPTEYSELAARAFAETGFFESEIGRTEEEFGPIVQRFSAYQSKRSPDDPEPFARGINSFQVMYDGSRWWIVTIFWTSETPELVIPPKYLGGGPGV